MCQGHPFGFATLRHCWDHPGTYKFFISKFPPFLMSTRQRILHSVATPIVPSTPGVGRDQPAIWSGARLESALRPLHPPPLKVVSALGNSTMHPSLSPRLVSTDHRAHLHSIARMSKSATDHNSCCNSHYHQLNICQCCF